MFQKVIFPFFSVANRAAKSNSYGSFSALQAEGHPFDPDTAHHCNEAPREKKSKQMDGKAGSSAFVLVFLLGSSLCLLAPRFSRLTILPANLDGAMRP